MTPTIFGWWPKATKQGLSTGDLYSEIWWKLSAIADEMVQVPGKDVALSRVLINQLSVAQELSLHTV